MMPDRKVIYDSEDEDAGLSPLNSPFQGHATNADVALEGEAIDATGQLQHVMDISETRSTDPDFFRKVYDEQQVLDAEVVPDSARDGPRNMGSSDRLKSSSRNAKDNSSSLTDPTLKSAKGVNRVERADFTSLTQVTTPRNAVPSLPRDVYDFPSSNEEGDAAETSTPKRKAKVTKSFSKRKRGEIVTPAKTAVSSSPAHPSSQDGGLTTQPRDEDESARPSRKKRKSGTQQSLAQIPEDVDLLVIPRTADVNESPAEARVGNEGSGGTVPDTYKEEQSAIEHPPASFFIAPPSRLTASQKQEYVRVSGSSDHEREEKHGSSFPVPQAQTQVQQIRSSEATIAYTTPSIYCSTPNFPDLQETGDRGSSGTMASIRQRANITGTDAILPHSSPDELSSHSPDQTLPKPKRRRGGDADDELAQDDAWDSDDIGIPQEQYVPRPSRRRTGPDPYEVHEGRTLAGDSGSAKKRLKTGQHVDVAQEDSWDSDKIGAHRETYKPRQSRRRSRAVQEDAEEVTPGQSMPDTCPPGPVSSGGMESAEPVLISSGQQAPRGEVETIEGIDPDYLAALPRELRQEVISDHMARNAQVSRTRGRGRPSQPMSTLVPNPEEAPQPKKRGRKKKEPISEEALAPAQDTDAQEPPATILPAKRKRGRPKKSEAVQLAPAAETDDDISFAYEVENVPHVAEDDSVAEEYLPAAPVHEAPVPAKAPSKRGRKKKVVEEAPIAPEEEPAELDAEDVPPSEPVDTIDETKKAPSKRGRKKKVVEEPRAAVEDEVEEGGDNAQDPNSEVEEADASRMPLQDISNTSTKEKEVTPEAKAKEPPKSASSTTGQGQGKVPLRVGLSKRSRIAPLLKIIRK